MEHKASDLGRFLTMKSIEIDFEKPAPALQRDDRRELRAKTVDSNPVGRTEHNSLLRRKGMLVAYD